jgi:hypothetical protein
MSDEYDCECEWCSGCDCACHDDASDDVGEPGEPSELSEYFERAYGDLSYTKLISRFS